MALGDSWVITRRATGEVIGEFYEWANVVKFNPATCLIETAYEYLTRLNRETKERNRANGTYHQ